jgi:hypothetical protein
MRLRLAKFTVLTVLALVVIAWLFWCGFWAYFWFDAVGGDMGTALGIISIVAGFLGLGMTDAIWQSEKVKAAKGEAAKE